MLKSLYGLGAFKPLSCTEASLGFGKIERLGSVKNSPSPAQTSKKTSMESDPNSHWNR